MSWCVGVLAVFLAFLAVIVAYSKRAYKYWERKNVPIINPTIPFGSFGNPFFRKITQTVGLSYMYKYLKERGYKHGGAFQMLRHIYIPVDLELIRNILTRDFNYFSDRGLPYKENDPIGANLFNLKTKQWRHVRTKLTPTFTSGKMKMMFPLLVECSVPLVKTLDDYAKTGEAVNIKEVLGCFTTDVIGTCAFGIECNSFDNPNSDFRRYGKAVFHVSRLQVIRNIVSASFPKIGFFINKFLEREKVSKFFVELVQSTVQYRKKNDIVRNDFMQLLINLGDELTLEEMTAQAFVFFVAGFETSSTTSSYALYDLAVNPHIQDRLREEVNAVLKEHDGTLTYEALHDMKYMNQVVDETLRLHSPAALLIRKCVKDYQIPDSDVVIEAGTRVFISTLGIHRDPDYFPNPEKFDPDRFSEENKSNIKPYTFMPFGEGPRNCIGLRFGVMQTKAVLAILLKNYEVSLSIKTMVPFTVDTKSFIHWVKGDIWLNFTKIEQ